MSGVIALPAKPRRLLKPRVAMVILIVLSAIAATTVILYYVEASGYLTVVVPGDVLGDVRGYAEVYLSYPGGYSVAFTPFGGRDVVVRLPTHGTAGARTPEPWRSLGRGVYAGVMVVFYGYTDRGPCVATYSYSTLTMYMDRLGDPVEAVRQATRNPYALLDLHRIVVEKRHLTPCTTINTSALLNIPGAGERTGLKAQRGPLSAERMPGGPPPCPIDFEVVGFPWLLNASRNPPPSFWSSRIQFRAGTPPDQREQIAGQLWRSFLQPFAWAYYIPADSCSPSDAVESVLVTAQLPEPGVWPMDRFVTGWLTGLASSGSSVIGWNDTYPRGAVIARYEHAPLLRLIYAYRGPGSPPMKPFAGIVFGYAAGIEEKSGLALFGKVVIGSFTYPISSGGEGLNVPPSLAPSGVSVSYVFAPLDIVYWYDAIVVFYDVHRETVNGTDYWVVIPLFRFTPIYSLAYNLEKLSVVKDDYENPRYQITETLNEEYQMLTAILAAQHETNMPSPLTTTIVLDTYLQPTPSDITLDASRTGRAGDTSLAWLASPLFNALAAQAMPAFFAGGRALWGLSTLPTGTLGLSHTTLNSASLTKLFIDTVPEAVHVTLCKETFSKAYLADAYSQAGTTPLVHSYTLIVEPAQGRATSTTPPCTEGLGR